MRRGIIRLLTLVAPLSNDSSVPQHDSANGHLAGIGSVTGKVKCDFHRVEFNRTDHGGGGGIRTHGGLHLTRFPSVPIRPLSHPSKDDADAYQFRVEAIGEGRHTSWR